MSLQPTVALCQLPWAAVERPSIALGLLKAILARHGVGSRLVPLNLALARQLGMPLYQLCSQQLAQGAGEWMFARALFGDAVPDYLRWLRPRHQGGFNERAWADLRQTVDHGVPDFLAGVPAAIEHSLGQPPRILGLSATHDQLLAALAVGRRVKDAWPDCLVVLGGSQVAAPAARALVDAFDFIDWVVDGEADQVAGPLFEELLAGAPLSVPHALAGPGRGVVHGDARLPTDLDALPTPDFSDYLAAHPEQLGRGVELPIELSRGCWYEDLHGACTFCGLCQHHYRSKGGERIAAEVRELVQRTWLLDFFTTDTLVPQQALGALAGLDDLDVRLFAEVRTQMAHGQVQRLAKAGMTRVQPGVESFDSRLLGLMNKGADALDNVGFLKSAATLGMSAIYNVLYGIPGEEASDYERMLDLLPRLHHLPPPGYLVRMNLARFSPFFDRPWDFGIGRVRPADVHRFLFPDGAVDLSRVAYFHEGDFASAAEDPVIDRVHAAVVTWARAYGAGATLRMRRAGPKVRITDARDPEAGRAMVLQGDGATVLLACAEPVRLDALARRTGLDEHRLQAAVGELVGLDLALAEGDRVLALPLPYDAPPGIPPPFSPLRVDRGLPVQLRET